MTAPIVPPDADDTGESPASDAARHARRVRRWWIAGIAMFVLAGVTWAAFLVELPYYLLQPGSVRPAEQRIEIEGAPSYETDGEVMFTTVYLTRATPALMVRAWLDDAVKIRREDEVYPDGDREGNQRLNRQRMDLSKLVATNVALDVVGIDAEYDAEGARVLGLAEDSPAADLLAPGDVIVVVDGAEVAMPDDIGQELTDRAPGDTVDVQVRRNGEGDPEDLQVVLGAAPDEPERPVLGIVAEPVDPSIRSDVQVQVDSGQVSGPSAGLAWTLAIIDRLTPGSLTGGRQVAVTGEIRDDGSVGPIGGVVQKVAAVRRAGIELFLYPADTPEDEQRQMRRIAGDDVELRPVATIDEAVEVLAPEGLQAPS
jgi:PDZ domain-containing protein